MLEKLEKHLDTLAGTLSLEDLKLDENKQAFLLFDNTLLVRLAYNESRNSVHFSSKISDIDEDLSNDKKMKIWNLLLEANLFWIGSQGNVLSLDDSGETIMIQLEESLFALDYERFEKLLENFVNSLEFWIGNISEIEKASSEKVEIHR